MTERTLDHDQTPSYRTINGFYFSEGSDTEEEHEFREKLDNEITETLDREAESFDAVYDTESPLERFRHIRGFIGLRKEQIYEQMNGGTVEDGCAQSFAILKYLEGRTDSRYTERLIEWAMMREAHVVAEGLTEVDREKSLPDLVKRYDDGDNPSGLVYTLNQAGKESITRNPALASLLEFTCDQQMLYPQLGDSDYYTPSPYTALLDDDPQTVSAIEQEPDGELLLETRHLFDLKYEQIDPELRQRLYEFGAAMSDEMYRRVREAVFHVPGNGRETFARAFLATEFGDDFGDKVLTIAERAVPEQSHRVFEIINRFRGFSEQFSGWFTAYDTEFATSVERAINERLTDALTALAQVAEHGSLKVDVSPNDARLSEAGDGRFVYELHSMEETLETLELLDTATIQLGTVVGDKNAAVNRVTMPNENFSTFRISSDKHGAAILYIRPEGAKGYDQQYEYGNRLGVEASISFIVNPKHPHSLRPDKDPEGVSIRFDREGRTPDETPNSPDRDPTREDGLVSVDISSLMGEKSSSAARIGQFIAAGNRLRARAIGTEDSLHHNVLSDQRYGKASNFKRLAHYLEAGMDALARAHRPTARTIGASVMRSQIRRAASGHPSS